MTSGRSDRNHLRQTTPRRHRWTRTLGLVAVLFVIMIVPPAAQPRQLAANVAGAPGVLVEQLDLLVGRSAVLRMDRPITRVSLSTADIADALVTSPYEVLVHGKAPGTISLLIWGDTGAIRSYDVAVRRDLGVLEQRLQQLFPGESIAVASNGTDVVLSGIVSTKYVVDKAAAVAVGYVEDAENVVNLLQQQEGVATNQILLRVRFAEVSRTALQELGASFFTGLFGHEDWIARTTTQQFPAPEFDSEKGLVFSDFLNLLAFNTEEQLGAVVRALSVRGLFQSLAEPNLVTQNGREASFLAGGEYPYPVLQGSGLNAAVTILFKEFGVRLRFTPTVVGEDLIHLQVEPEVSALDFSNAVTIEGFRVPALSTRRTSTEVELRDGQTFAISGLIDNTVTETMSKVPGIGDIPILGLLFRSRAYQKDATELVVMITPHIVRRDEPGVTPNLPNMVQPFLPPPDEVLPPPPPAFIGPRSQASTLPPSMPVNATTLAVSPAEAPAVSAVEPPAASTVEPAVTSSSSAGVAPANHGPAARPSAPIAGGVSAAMNVVDAPVRRVVERPAPSDVERLVVGSVEPVSMLNRAPLSAAPVETDVDDVFTRAERQAIERAVRDEAKRIEEEREAAERAREEEERRLAEERQAAARLARQQAEQAEQAERQARAQAEIDERQARAQAEIDRRRFEEERRQAERDRKAAEKLAAEEAERQAEEAERFAEAEKERLERERAQAETQRKAEEKLAKEAAKREAEIGKILAEHNREVEETERRLGVEQLDAGTRLVIPMSDPQTR